MELSSLDGAISVTREPMGEDLRRSAPVGAVELVPRVEVSTIMNGISEICR